MAHNQFLTDFYEYTTVQPEPLEKYMNLTKQKFGKRQWTEACLR